MKSITICQPYAELILLGEKLVENRTWGVPLVDCVPYRGPLLIHAGASTKWLDTYKPLPDKMDFGAIVGVVNLTNCFQVNYLRGTHCDDRYKYLAHHEHTSGPFCWVLENPRRFVEPIPYRGRQGLFDIPIEVVQEALTHVNRNG